MSKFIIHGKFGKTYQKLSDSKTWNDKKDLQVLQENHFKEFLTVQRHPSLTYFKAVGMKAEVNSATAFLTRLITKLNSKLNIKQIMQFKKHLHGILTIKFAQHWYEDKPWKGQAYRCIRINQLYRNDPVLCEAALLAGIEYKELKLPLEFTVWIDPKEVCCRFGESRGSIFTIASFTEERKHRTDPSWSLLKQVEDVGFEEIIDKRHKNFCQNKSRRHGR
ncbi:protein BTG3-like [Centruroides sculpturatus]|uniref:protein BTG3-like n=1 Tax=Centruroides sculpturatus TaxID=218467 RepID=UPI000C6EFC85|nr:protein BTG3-like [Centruroides sculpturatus]